MTALHVSQRQIRMSQDTDFTLFTDFYINSNPSSICWKPENYREIERTLQIYLQTLYFHPFKWISLYMYFVQYMWYILQRVLSFFMFSSIHGNDSRKLMGRDHKLFWCAALCKIVWAISKRPIPWTAGAPYHSILFLKVERHSLHPLHPGFKFWVSHCLSSSAQIKWLCFG